MPTVSAGRREFIQLQRHWYQRLKAEGFKDIEQLLPDGNMGDLLARRGPKPERILEQQDDHYNFYRLCSEFLHSHNFEHPTSFQIWQMYCEGVAYRSIATQLNLSLAKVHRRIHKIMRGPFQSFKLNAGSE